MTRVEIEELLSAMGVEHALVNESAYHVSFHKETFRIEFLVPVNVLELYIDVYETDGRKIYSQWFDYYGKDAVQDFIEDLTDILAILRDNSIRHNMQTKCLEYSSSGMWKKFA